MGETDAAGQLRVAGEAFLDAFPGGVESGPGIISWDEGATVLTLDGAVSAQAIGTCAAG